MSFVAGFIAGIVALPLIGALLLIRALLRGGSIPFMR